jgi:hypothetical protein
MINARIIIGNLLKNAAVVAQPITPNKLKAMGKFICGLGREQGIEYQMSRWSLLLEKNEARPGTYKHETRDPLLIESGEYLRIAPHTGLPCLEIIHAVPC